MSSPKVWRTMWEATGKLAGKIGLTMPGESELSKAERPATRCPQCEQHQNESPEASAGSQGVAEHHGSFGW